MRSARNAGLAVLAATTLALAGCSNPGEGEAGDSGAQEELGAATILTNWFAQAEQGPYWAAEAEQLAEERGVSLSVSEGGPGIQTIPQVAAGEADFGVGNADEIAVAAANGLPVVAVMAGFEQNIQCLAYHESTGIEDFDDLNGYRVAQSLIPYWDYLKHEYSLDEVEEVNIGSLAIFEEDEDLVQQCFFTSEPFVIEQEGIADIGYLMVRDSGFNPYQNMLFTTQGLIDENPELVNAVVEASIEGWDAMLEDPAATKELILEVNNDADPDLFDYTIDMLRDDPSLIGENPGAQSDGRWETLGEQLVEIDLVSEDFDITQAYTTQFSNG